MEHIKGIRQVRKMHCDIMTVRQLVTWPREFSDLNLGLQTGGLEVIYHISQSIQANSRTRL
jgi:hypothetical protein